MNPLAVGAVAPLAQSGPVIPNFGRGDECIRNNGKFCLHWFLDNFNDRFLPRVGEHLKMTAIAVVIGFLIAFAAALVAHRHRGFELPFANVASLFYTIPSIALFQIMVPITGIGWTTIIIALVSYTLLILFRNILTGLREVPAEVKEAAEGMGLTRRQTLMKVELPLAVPAIIAGLRVATVTTISPPSPPRPPHPPKKSERHPRRSRHPVTPSAQPQRLPTRRASPPKRSRHAGTVARGLAPA
jgi:osmoprotectant transport system permease protein